MAHKRALPLERQKRVTDLNNEIWKQPLENSSTLLSSSSNESSSETAYDTTDDDNDSKYQLTNEPKASEFKEIEQIVNARIMNNKFEYEVRFINEIITQWIPKTNFDDPEVLVEYWAKKT